MKTTLFFSCWFVASLLVLCIGWWTSWTMFTRTPDCQCILQFDAVSISLFGGRCFPRHLILKGNIRWDNPMWEEKPFTEVERIWFWFTDKKNESDTVVPFVCCVDNLSESIVHQTHFQKNTIWAVINHFAITIIPLVSTWMNLLVCYLISIHSVIVHRNHWLL